MAPPIDAPQTTRPNTPLGYLIVALQEGRTDMDRIRERFPLVFSAYTDRDLFSLIKSLLAIRTAEGVPPAANLILLDEHVRRAHAVADPHDHGLNNEYVHDHTRELARLREEVKTMPKGGTKTEKKKVEKAKAKAEKVEKSKRPCHCGCGGETFGNFVPGHDARVYSMLKKEKAGEKVTLPKLLAGNADLIATMRARVH